MLVVQSYQLPSHSQDLHPQPHPSKTAFKVFLWVHPIQCLLLLLLILLFLLLFLFEPFPPSQRRCFTGPCTECWVACCIPICRLVWVYKEQSGHTCLLCVSGFSRRHLFGWDLTFLPTTPSCFLLQTEALTPQGTQTALGGGKLHEPEAELWKYMHTPAQRLD